MPLPYTLPFLLGDPEQPPTATITITGSTPTIVNSNSLVPSTVTITITGSTPALTDSWSSSPPTAVVTITPGVAQLASYESSPPTALLVIIGGAPQAPPVGGSATAGKASKVIAPSPRITGAVFYGRVGTPLPTSSYAALDPGFTDLGYVDESGLKQKEDRSNKDVFVWGGDDISTLQEKYSRTMQFKLYQFLDSNVLAAGYRNANTTVIPATGVEGNEVAVQMNSQALDVLSWVFDGYYFTSAGYEALVRIVIPIGRITQMGEVNLSSKELVSMDATLKAFPDLTGNHGYMYVNDGIYTGGAGVGGS